MRQAARTWHSPCALTGELEKPQPGLRPSLFPVLLSMPLDTTTTSTPLARKRKADSQATARDASESSSSENSSDAGVGPRKSHRGKKWTPRDSILLVKAYAWKEGYRKRTSNFEELL